MEKYAQFKGALFIPEKVAKDKIITDFLTSMESKDFYLANEDKYLNFNYLYKMFLGTSRLNFTGESTYTKPDLKNHIELTEEFTNNNNYLKFVDKIIEFQDIFSKPVIFIQEEKISGNLCRPTSKNRPILKHTNKRGWLFWTKRTNRKTTITFRNEETSTDTVIYNDFYLINHHWQEGITLEKNDSNGVELLHAIDQEVKHSSSKYNLQNSSCLIKNDNLVDILIDLNASYFVEGTSITYLRDALKNAIVKFVKYDKSCKKGFCFYRLYNPHDIWHDLLDGHFIDKIIKPQLRDSQTTLF